MQSTAYSYDAILTLSEQLQTLMKDLELDKYEKILTEYTVAVQQYFINATGKNLTHVDIEKLNHIKSGHEVIRNHVQQEKDKLIREIKLVNIGKEMRNTYPDIS